MISELISPPPPSLSDDDDEEEEESESELEDSDDDFTRRGATAAAATAAADDDDTLSLDGKSSSSSSRKKKKPSPYPPALGARGGGWVLAQFVALFLVVFPPTAITLAIQVLGIFALLAGIALAAAGVGSIGVRSLSPFPVPRRSNQLSERGGLRARSAPYVRRAYFVLRGRRGGVGEPRARRGGARPFSYTRKQDSP